MFWCHNVPSKLVTSSLYSNKLQTLLAPIAPRLKRLFSQSLSILKKDFFLDRRAKIIFLPILYCFTKQKICGLSLNFCRIFNRFRCCISKQFKQNYFSIKINENNVCIVQCYFEYADLRWNVQKSVYLYLWFLCALRNLLSAKMEEIIFKWQLLGNLGSTLVN